MGSAERALLWRELDSLSLQWKHTMSLAKASRGLGALAQVASAGTRSCVEGVSPLAWSLWLPHRLLSTQRGLNGGAIDCDGRDRETGGAWSSDGVLHGGDDAMPGPSPSVARDAVDALNTTSMAPTYVCELDAASATEVLMMMVSPTQLACQALNAAHATGLPWWAAIPAATLGMRAVTLPLSLRAKAASANFLLLNGSLEKARLVREALQASHLQQQQGGPNPALPIPSMWRLTREIVGYERKQQGVPSMRWYWVNAAVQVRIHEACVCMCVALFLLSCGRELLVFSVKVCVVALVGDCKVHTAADQETSGHGQLSAC